jgi:threonine aldolase
MPSPDGSADFRSDTLTTPTPEMRRAMADAEVGDDAYGEDPTVNALQDLAAGLLGKEAALYVPSGTMANQIALRLLARPATEVLTPERSHIRCYEAAAAGRNAGVQFRTFADRAGTFRAADVDAAVAGIAHHLPPISLVTVENTHMASGGRVWPPADLFEVCRAARRHGLPVHCDGARIWNAALAVGLRPADLAAPVDTIMFCLSKGLSAPVGSLLCGPSDLIAAARTERSRLGGGMRQAGVIAAAGIVALQRMTGRLADDHARARRLADAIADRFPGSCEPERVQTNIVCADAGRLPAGFLDQLAALGVKAGTIDPHTVRFVTHKDIDDADLDRAVDALDKLAAG